jgi:hypothetical protein
MERSPEGIWPKPTPARKLADISPSTDMPSFRSEAINGKITEELNQNIPEKRLVRNRMEIAGGLVSRFNWIFQDESCLSKKVSYEGP